MEELIDKTLLNQALVKWGETSQTDMAIEECSELITAIIHHYRGRQDNIIEEIADVSIATYQLRLMFGPEKVDEIILQKMERLKLRLQENKLCTTP